MRPQCTFAFVIASILAISTLLVAQQAPTSVLPGVVSDSSRGALPGVIVKIVGPAPAVAERSTTTNQNGEYRFVDVAPGVYALHATLAGFLMMGQMQVTVDAGTTKPVNVTLKLRSTLSELIIRQRCCIRR
jgi:hypothetical protein